MATHLVWFRADLRIHDNLALAAACRDPHAEVLGLFIATPGQWRQHGMAPRQAAFMVSHLHSLQAALAEKGIPLQIAHAADFTASVALLASICRQRSRVRSPASVRLSLRVVRCSKRAPAHCSICAR